MEKDSAGAYLDDVRLDTISGLIHKEFRSLWCHHADSVKFDMLMGLYIDECYPTVVVRNVLFEKLNPNHTRKNFRKFIWAVQKIPCFAMESYEIEKPLAIC